MGYMGTSMTKEELDAVANNYKAASSQPKTGTLPGPYIQSDGSVSSGKTVTLPPTPTPAPAAVNGTLQGPFPTRDAAGNITSIQQGMSVVDGKAVPNTNGTTQPQDSAQLTAQAYIDQLNKARKEAAYASLGKAHDAALSNLSNEKASIQPKYYDAKNQVAAGGQQIARNFAEYMASRGSTSSGATAQADLTRNVSTQGDIGELGRQEAAAYTDVARRTTDVNNAYESDKAAADANAEADSLQLLIQDYYAAQQRADTQGQNAILNKIAEAQLKLQQDAQDYNQNPNNPINVGANLNNQLTDLQLKDYPAQSVAAAQKTQQDLATGKINQQVAEFQLQQLKDPKSPANLSAALDLKLKQLDVDFLPKQQKLQLEQLRKSIEQIGKIPYQSENDKEMDKVKLDTANEQYKQLVEAGKTPKPEEKADVSQNIDFINNNYYKEVPAVPGDLLGPKTKVFDKEAAQTYVNGLPTNKRNALAEIYSLAAVTDDEILKYLK